MPMHTGLFPREGFCADVILNLIRKIALNPSLLLPLVLLARFTKKGEDLTILHPTAASRIKALLWISLARGVSNWFSERVRNNWTSDKYDWTKEIVLITGGAGGIGGSMVKILDEMGITVVVLDIQPMTFEVSANVHYFQCDLRSPDNISAVAEKVRSQVGNPTVLINNAGIARGKTLMDAKPSDIRLTFDVNTLAPFWIANTFLPDMIAKNHGMIVTVSSYAAWVTIPNMVDYGASKAGALAFHEGITAELKTRYNAPKIRTVIVHPGHTKTPLFTGYDQKTAFMMPQQEPESIAEAVIKHVLSGKSGQVVLPEVGGILSSLRALPDWYSIRKRAGAQSYMSNFNGRQVLKDADLLPQESQQYAPSESTVLVAKEG